MPDHNASLETQRVTALVHYVIAKTDPGKLGYVKLNLILWYSDLEHNRWHGASITGLRHYTRTLQGPTAKEILPAVRRLVKDGKVEERTVKVKDYARREMLSLDEPDVSMLTAEQIDILDQIIKFIAPLTASQLTRLTHDDPLWQELENNKPMPVATGSVMTRLPSSAVKRPPKPK